MPEIAPFLGAMVCVVLLTTGPVSAATTAIQVPNQSTFEGWPDHHFAEEERNSPNVHESDASAAGDGVSNLMKYALFMDPRKHLEPGRIPVISQVDGRLRLSNSGRTGAEDIDCQVEVSSDLAHWRSGASHVYEIYRYSSRPDVDDVIVESVPEEDVSATFMRLQVVKP